METVEVSHDALEALWAHVDVEKMNEFNPDACDEVQAILKAQESDRVTVNHGSDSVSHDFSEGDYALDSNEPTPSPEANTVEILETTGQRADEYVVEETGKTVAEHNEFYPSDDPVVVGHYPHMGGDKTFAFPESRLRKV